MSPFLVFPSGSKLFLFILDLRIFYVNFDYQQKVTGTSIHCYCSIYKLNLLGL